MVLVHKHIFLINVDETCVKILQALMLVHLGQYDGYLCILYDESQTRERRGRIKRDVGPSGFEHGQQRYDHLTTTLQTDAHDDVRPDD